MTTHHPHRAAPDDSVAGWTVEHYARIVKWPAIATVVLNIIVTTANWNPSLSWLFLIVVVIGLGVYAARAAGGKLANAAGLGFTSGLLVGVFSSLYRFIWFRSVETFFEIITTTMLAVLVGMLMSTSAFLVVTKEPTFSRFSRRQIKT